MRYSLRQLEVFLQIAHFENITRAAQQMNMSQSAASSALSDLEKHFNIQLFDRIGKRLQLNEMGRTLRPKALDLIEQAQALEQILSIQNSAPVLNVGATLTIGNYLAIGIMASFMREEPQAQITLAVANTETIAKKISNFELDIGLIEGELRHPELRIIPWLEDELVVFCAPQHPLNHGKTLSDSDLSQATWIMREPGSGTRQTFDRAMHGLLPQMNILLELEHTEAIKRAVEANLGIACLSKVTLKEAFHRGDLIPLAVPQRNLHRRFYFIHHREKHVSRAMKHWMNLCELLDQTP